MVTGEAGDVLVDIGLEAGGLDKVSFHVRVLLGVGVGCHQ
jgi:hypothetical protein